MDLSILLTKPAVHCGDHAQDITIAVAVRPDALLAAVAASPTTERTPS